MGSTRIAVLMTCHNRRETTVSCLESVKAQKTARNLSLEAYVVDDGSEDGTAEAVRETMPKVHLLLGSGNLYWGGGMRMAFAEAMKDDFHFFLFMNDDVVLEPNAVDTLIAAFEETRKAGDLDPIICGSLRHPDTGIHTYGGLARSSRINPLDFSLIEPVKEARRCITFNCNCLLVPKQAAELLGNLSPEFTHFIGDIDYGLRATEKGIPCWVAPGYLGVCPDNGYFGTWMDEAIPFKERIRLRASPKGLPQREWVIFAKRHAGRLWPIYLITSQLRILMPGVWDFLHGRRARR